MCCYVYLITVQNNLKHSVWTRLRIWKANYDGAAFGRCGSKREDGSQKTDTVQYRRVYWNIKRIVAV